MDLLMFVFPISKPKIFEDIFRVLPVNYPERKLYFSFFLGKNRLIIAQ